MRGEGDGPEKVEGEWEVKEEGGGTPEGSGRGRRRRIKRQKFKGIWGRWRGKSWR